MTIGALFESGLSCSLVFQFGVKVVAGSDAGQVIAWDRSVCISGTGIGGFCLEHPLPGGRGIHHVLLLTIPPQISECRSQT